MVIIFQSIIVDILKNLKHNRGNKYYKTKEILHNHRLALIILVIRTSPAQTLTKMAMYLFKSLIRD